MQMMFKSLSKNGPCPSYNLFPDFAVITSAHQCRRNSDAAFLSPHGLLSDDKPHQLLNVINALDAGQLVL